MRRPDLVLRILRECKYDKEFLEYQKVTKEVAADFYALTNQYSDEDREVIGEYLSFREALAFSLASFAYELGARDAREGKDPSAEDESYF